jgi:uncharacterized protein YdeI (YjbR/CyaY-like superfamily)
MTEVDQLAVMLKQLTPRQLQQLMSRTSNVDGSKIRQAKNSRTETYFARVKDEGLYPHNYPTFPQFREVLK